MKRSDDIRTIFSLIFADVVYTGTAATQTNKIGTQLIRLSQNIFHTKPDSI